MDSTASDRTAPKDRQPPAESCGLPRCRWLLLVMLCLFGAPTLAGETLVLNTTVSPPIFDPEHRESFLDQLISAAFARLGYTVEIVRLPAERALLNADAGVDDGTLFRVGGLSRLYPNLSMIPESLLDFRFMVFTQRDDIQVVDWDSLAPYVVGMIKGWKIVEANLPATRGLVVVRRPQQLFRLLAEGRVDLVIYGDWLGAYWIEQLDLVGVRALSPPLAHELMFAYLNERHGALVDPLAHALRDMKADGSYGDIMQRTLCELRPEWGDCVSAVILETPYR